MNPLANLAKAESLIEKDRHAAALPLLRSAERETTDKFLRAEISWRLAECLRALGWFQEALDAYWRSHRLYRLCDVSSERLRTLLGASACLRILGRYPEARRVWTSVAKQKFFQSPDPSPEEVQLEIALVERGLGNHGQAGKILRRCLPALQKQGDVEALQHAWWALGGVERFSGHYDRALAAFKKAEHYARLLGDDAARGYALCGQAGSLRILGRGRESFQKYRLAYQFSKKLKDPFGQAYGLCGMGNAERVWGDARKTLPLYKKSAALYDRVGDEGSMAFAFWGLGGSLRRLGDLAASGAHYKKALSLFQKVGDHRGVIMALLGLGRVRALEKKSREAELFVEKALRLSSKEKLPYETALSRMEKSRLAGRKPNASALRSCGILPSVAARWLDLP